MDWRDGHWETKGSPKSGKGKPKGGKGNDEKPTRKPRVTGYAVCLHCSGWEWNSAKATFCKGCANQQKVMDRIRYISLYAWEPSAPWLQTIVVLLGCVVRNGILAAVRASPHCSKNWKHGKKWKAVI